MQNMVKKSPGSGSGDRHKKKQTQLRLHPVIRRQLEILVEQRVSDLTEEITEAIRKHLRDHNLWPPPKPEPREEDSAE